MTPCRRTWSPAICIEVELPDVDVYRILLTPRPTALVASQVAFCEGFCPLRERPFRWMGTTGAMVAWPFAPTGTEVGLEASCRASPGRAGSR